MPDDDRQLALAFVAELEKALAAIRSGDVDGIAYAEIQPTSLFLLERSKRVRDLLRKQYRDLSYKPAFQQSLRGCVISNFSSVQTESAPSNLTHGDG
jgi:hypothetical protein